VRQKFSERPGITRRYKWCDFYGISWLILPVLRRRPVRQFALILALLVVTLSAAPQVQPGRIEGIVINSKSKETVSGAEITVFVDGTTDAPRGAVSDASGRFSIGNLPPARYRVTAYSDLLLPKQNLGGVIATIESGESIRDLRLELEPTGIITGRILDENRIPQAGAAVQAVRYTYGPRGRQLRMVLEETTDERGNYRLFGLAPGNYYIRAVAKQPEWAAPTFHPATPDSQQATPIKVEPAVEVGGIDVHLISVKAYPVRFKLAGMPNEPTPDRYISIDAATRDGVWEGLNLETERLRDDEFRVHRLRPGSYDLKVVVRVRADDAGPFSGFLRAEIADTPDAEIDLGVITLRDSVPVIGRLVIPQGLFPADFDWSAVTARLDPIEGPFAFGPASGGQVLESGPDGKIARIRVPPFGRYVPGFDALPPGIFLTAVRYEGKDILGSGLLLDGEAKGPLDFILAGPESVGSVAGTVRNAKFETVARSTVVLIPEASRRSSSVTWRVTTTDSSGAFEIRNALPGEYGIVAWEEIESNAWRDPRFLKDFETRAVMVTIRAGIGTALNNVPLIEAK
jgi:hypothetical protein